eukprot:tig00021432_g21238.t1
MGKKKGAGGEKRDKGAGGGAGGGGKRGRRHSRDSAQDEEAGGDGLPEPVSSAVDSGSSSRARTPSAEGRGMHDAGVEEEEEEMDIDGCEEEEEKGLSVSWPMTPEKAQALIADLAKGKALSASALSQILKKGLALLKKEDNVVEVGAPQEGQRVIVCGDTHGQFHDVLTIFKKAGFPSPSQAFVFNGDYVDRGDDGVEVVVTLLLLKLANPRSLHMTRGNHETRFCSKAYGFADEVERKYSKKVSSAPLPRTPAPSPEDAPPQMYKPFLDVFFALPLGVRIANRILVVHGGLWASRKDRQVLGTLEDLMETPRQCEPKLKSPLEEVLWSDPGRKFGLHPNEFRGCGLRYGPDVLEEFLQRNALTTLIRSHEGPDTRPEMSKGYHVDIPNKLITIFSAPNYLGTCGNQAAYITLSGPKLSLDFEQFSQVQKPS